jgi:hypothetical protein
MNINNYQKNVLLDLLNNRKKDEEYTINKLIQTINHNENWAMPIAKNTGNEKVIKSMIEVVINAKRDIETNKKDLDQINDLIDKIKNLVDNNL